MTPIPLRPAPPGQRPAARTGAAILIAAALALVTAACGGSPSSADPGGSPGAGGSASSQLVAYSQCMRSRGVPSFPDPTSEGLPKVSAQGLGVSASQLQAAQGACQHLLPTSQSFQQQVQQCMLAGDCPPALVQQVLTAERKFAQCMRAHGVPRWPDPTIGSEGRPIFNLTTVGITHSEAHSPPITTTLSECQRLDPSPVPMESD